MSSKGETASRLARSHYVVDSEVVAIRRIVAEPDREDRPDEPVKLLEVNAATVPAGILPVAFDAHPASGVDYPSIIVEVTPDEFQEIKEGRLRLPDGWSLGDEIAPPPAAERVEA